MVISEVPAWVLALETEELQLIKQFVLHSGSLKDLAQIEEVTYPTIRLRIDRLIARIKLAETVQKDEFTELLTQLTLDEAIKPAAARQLLQVYKQGRQQLSP